MRSGIKYIPNLSLGPAAMVTAAFIGPGTVITASLAGANFGFALLWALLFAVIASLILQEMTARLGIITGQGLGESIRHVFSQPLPRGVAILLVVSAIVIGNAAYQGGNISGAAMGINSLFATSSAKDIGLNPWPLAIGGIAFLLLWFGDYLRIEKVLVGLVGLMSVAFIVTFILSKPDLGALFGGLFIPSLPTGSRLTVIALIGTTVVPYNLFLHSASVAQKWKGEKSLPLARRDLLVSIPLGGLVSIAIVATAASAFFGQQIQLKNGAMVAASLRPLFGDWASLFMGLGLFAAGISSALTAPLAAAYALSGILGLDSKEQRRGMRSWHFRLVWVLILLSGTLIASLGLRPIKIIWFAQVANGLLLPIVTVFLLWVMNTARLGNYRNNLGHNMAGAFVLLATLLISGRSLLSAFGQL